MSAHNYKLDTKHEETHGKQEKSADIKIEKMFDKCSWVKLYYGVVSDLISKYQYTTCVEIGVAYGFHAESILNKNGHVKYFGVDPYIAGYDANDRFSTDVSECLQIKPQLALDTLYQYVKTKLQIKFKGRTQMIRDVSKNASKDFKDETVDLVFVDGDHRYEAVLTDLQAWWPKIQKGGRLCGDDFQLADVQKAVNQFSSDIKCDFSMLYKAGSDHVKQSKNRGSCKQKLKLLMEKHYALPDHKGHFLDHKLIQEFQRKQKGIFIEIGANDGVDQSNTKLLEETLGWTGLLIEPSPTAFAKLKKNRPLSNHEHCALVSFDYKNKTITGDFDDGHLMSSINGKRRNRAGIKTQVPAKTLKQVLREWKMEHQTIDFISLDTEGYELDILQGIDWDSGFRPLYWLIELYPFNEEPIHRLLKSYNYECVGNFSGYNKRDNPVWDGTHNDFLFRYSPKVSKVTEIIQSAKEMMLFDEKWRPQMKMKYPPHYHNGMLIEEAFTKYYTKYKCLLFPPQARYMDIWWTSLYCNALFSATPYDEKELQLAIDQQLVPLSLHQTDRKDQKNEKDEKGKKGEKGDKYFFTVVQFDDGIRQQLPFTGQTLVLSSGGGGTCTNYNYALPLLYEDRLNRLVLATHTATKTQKDTVIEQDQKDQTEKDEKHKINKSNKPKPTTMDRPILCSFLGRKTHRVRDEMFKILSNIDQFKLIESDGANDAQAFIQLGRQSVFMLAPRGYGRSSFRFVEALQLGCIPIDVYDDEDTVQWRVMHDYLQYDEQPFSLRISCLELITLPKLLSSFTKSQISNMKQQGQQLLQSVFTLDGCCRYIQRCVRHHMGYTNFSVAIPTYNRFQEFLQPLLKHLMPCPFIDEIIVMDDASTDGKQVETWLHLHDKNIDRKDIDNKEYKELKDYIYKIRVFTQVKNQGAFKNKISAVRHSRNRHVLLLDSDNKYDYDNLKLLFQTVLPPKTILSPSVAGPFNFNKEIGGTQDFISIHDYSFTSSKYNGFLNLGNYLVPRDEYVDTGNFLLHDATYSSIDPGPYDAIWMNYHLLKRCSLQIWKHRELKYDHVVHNGSLWITTHSKYETWYNQSFQPMCRQYVASLGNQKKIINS